MLPMSFKAWMRKFIMNRDEIEYPSYLEALGAAFFATGPGLGLIMYIFTTLEFPTHNFDFHILD